VLLRRRGQVSPGTPEAWIGKLEADRVTSLWMILIFPLIGAVLIAIGVALMWVGAT